MPKKQNKPTKTCSDCIHESACRGWTGGIYISDDSASRCPNHETVKESGAYLCGVLDERKRKQTNADRIRVMSDERMAVFLDGFSSRCLDCAEDAKNQSCPIYKEGHYCRPQEIMEWLRQPAEEADNGGLSSLSR